MPCWMLNLIKVQQACVGHRRGLRTPPPWAASASCNPSSMAAPVPGAWNAATATSLSSPARPAYWRHKREQMATATGPKAPPTTTCTGTLSPAMDGLEKSWPGSACLTRPSPWTYANPRSTSTGSGPPQAARMIALLRIRLATTMPTTSMTRTGDHLRGKEVARQYISRKGDISRLTAVNQCEFCCGTAHFVQQRTFVPAQSICRNPFVNFGAIIVTDRLPSLTGDAVTATIGLMRTANPAAPIASDDAVARSETMTGHRNSAIAHVLAEPHRLINEIDHGLAQYFAQCLGLCTKRFSRRICPAPTWWFLPIPSHWR